MSEAHSKRKADVQITKDHPGEEDDNGADGEDSSNPPSSNKATPEQLAQRRIIRVVRPVAQADTDNNNKTASAEKEQANVDEPSATNATMTETHKEDDEEAGEGNVFANVNLVTATGSTATGTTTSSIFGSSTGFKGFGALSAKSATSSTAATAASSDQESSTISASNPPSAKRQKKDHMEESPADVPAPALPPVTAPAPAPVFGSSSGFQGFGSVAAANITGSFAMAASSAANETGSAASTTNSTAAFAGFAAPFPFPSSSTATPFQFAQSLASAQGTTANALNDHQHATTAAVLPHDYKIESGEENMVLLLELRSKAYRWAKPTTAEGDMAGGAAGTGGSLAAIEVAAAPSVPPSEMLQQTTTTSNTTTTTTTETTGADAAASTTTDSNVTTTATTTTAVTSTTTAASPAAAVVVSATVPECKWIEAGVGPVRVLQNKENEKEGAPQHFGRITQRRQHNPKDNPTKVLVNCVLGKESTVSLQSERYVKITSISPTSTSGLPLDPLASSQVQHEQQSITSQYLFKFVSSDDAQQFHDICKRVIGSSKSFFGTALEGDDNNNGANQNGDEVAHVKDDAGSNGENHNMPDNDTEEPSGQDDEN